MHADSDIDIAFLGEQECSGYEIFLMAQELSNVLKKEIDLIDLSKASTVFKAQVIGTGKVIYCTENFDKDTFHIRVLKDYAFLNEERAGILKNIINRGVIYEN